MTAIYPMPSGRSSGTLLARRMLSQLQAAEKRLLRVEQQLTTGRRIQLSGEDPGAANRAVALQRLLELKEQFQVNTSMSRSYLNATDTALSGVANLLADVRGAAVQAANNTLTESERAALADRVQAAIDRMLTVGNGSFRGRYLFAGSSPSAQPFETRGDYVVYNGNDTVLRSPMGFGELLDTNVPGQELFGAVSRDVQGIDLNPVLTPATRLSDLRGGEGIRSGTIVISDGVSSRSVSVSETMTLGDVARLLAANPPEGREVRVTINARGLRVEMDAAGGGSLIVRDVPGGSTAAELGIARLAGSASTPIEGSDLDPILRPTTPLADLGIAWDQASGLRIVNGNTTHVISFSGAETVEDLLGILNRSSATVLAEINAERTGINVRSRLSGSDFAIGENGGTTASDLGLRSFTLDTRLDSLNHGGGVRVADGVDFTIRRNDGVELSVDVSSARTVADVVQLINNHPDNLDPATAVVARLSAVGNGIELVDDNPVGAGTLTVLRATGSYAAWDLGLIPSGSDTSGPVSQPAAPATASVRFAAPHDVNTALRLVAPGTGTQWNGVSIEFQNSLAGDVATATYDAMTRRLVIEVADGQTSANTVIAAVLAEGTFRAELDLSLDPTNNGSGTVVAPAGIAAVAQGGTPEVLTGRDAGVLETEGVFNSLIRLKQAIATADFSEIQRLQTLLDVDSERMSFGRAAVGARGQALDAITARNEDEQVELKSVLSDEIEVDMAVAASDFAARQAAYEASLRTIATMFRLSLMDFI